MTLTPDEKADATSRALDVARNKRHDMVTVSTIGRKIPPGASAICLRCGRTLEVFRDDDGKPGFRGDAIREQCRTTK